MKPRTLLKKLTDYGLTVYTNGAKIRLSPRQLVNDKVISFVTKNKTDLLTALYEVHIEKKNGLGNRLQVLRIAIKNCCIGKRSLMAEEEFWKHVEMQVDEILPKLGYDLEEAINYYRSQYLDQNFDLYGACKRCSYAPPFCKCAPSNTTSGVVCNDCQYFVPDKIGDGIGIGTCELGLTLTPAMIGGQMPLYRFAKRRCGDFVTRTKE